MLLDQTPEIHLHRANTNRTRRIDDPAVMHARA